VAKLSIDEFVRLEETKPCREDICGKVHQKPGTEPLLLLGDDTLDGVAVLPGVHAEGR